MNSEKTVEILNRFTEVGIIPVVVMNDAKDAEPLGKALMEGGLPAAEVTFRTDAAEESIRIMAEKYPDMLVGAGTVLTIEQVDRAVAAGAKFIVSPGFDEEIVKYCLEKDIPVCPGIKSLNNIFVKVGDGKMAPISEFVSLKRVVGPSSIEHFNLFQSISCYITPGGGYSEGEVHKVIAEVFKEEMPSSATYEYSGMSRELEETAGSNTTGLIYVICVILIYLILGSLYNSWFTPLAVLFSVPFGLMGAFVFAYFGNLLQLPGMDNNIYLQTGVIMLIGLLAKTAILITEFATERRAQGLTIVDAAFEACKERLRPILMTVATMIIGMIPLVIEGFI